MRITEYEHEPIRGLPGNLPAGEQILWQGAPDWRVFARSALFARLIGLYFAVLAAAALISGSIGGAIAITLSAVAALGLLALFAWGVARTTVYTITNRRLVLRIGVALNKCVNLPLQLIASAQLRELGSDYGDIALKIEAGTGSATPCSGRMLARCVWAGRSQCCAPLPMRLKLRAFWPKPVIRLSLTKTSLNSWVIHQLAS